MFMLNTKITLYCYNVRNYEECVNTGKEGYGTIVRMGKVESPRYVFLFNHFVQMNPGQNLHDKESRK